MEGHTWKDYLRLGFLPEIAGGETQPGEGTGSGYAGDAGGGEAPLPGTEGDLGGTDEGQPADAGGYEIDGERFTEDEIREWRDAHANYNSWQGAFKRRDMAMGQVRQALEFGFGKSLAEFNAADHDDVRLLSVLNNRLRRDQPFRKAFGEALQKISEQFPAGGQAPAATGTQPSGQDGQKIQQDPALLSRINRMEQREYDRTIASTSRSLKSLTEGTIQQLAADLKQFHPDFKEAILTAMYRYDDEELIAMEMDGRLEGEVKRIAREKIKRWRDHYTAGLKQAGQAVVAGRRNVPPAPARGSGAAPPAASRDFVPEKGRGLSGMHKSARAAMGI